MSCLALTQEGNKCRSVLEAKYDAYLHSAGLKHQHEVDVRTSYGNFIADFRVGEPLVEVVGMVGFYKYENRHEAKRIAYQKAKIPVIWLSPEDVERLYEPISKIAPITFLQVLICENCNTKTNDIVKGVCRKCYMLRWHRRENGSICFCGNIIQKDKGKFCSRKCYWESLVKQNPSPQAKYMRKLRGGLYQDRN